MAQDLTTAEVSAKYGASRRTIRRRIDDGSIVPLRKLPGTTGAYLFDAEDAERVFGRHDTEAVS